MEHLVLMEHLDFNGVLECSWSTCKGNAAFKKGIEHLKREQNTQDGIGASKKGMEHLRRECGILDEP